jgi:hypothetical protein
VPFIFEFLNRNLPGFSKDVVILNCGLHYRELDSGISLDLNNFAVYRAAIQRSGSWKMPLVVWADTLPRHFSTVSGGYAKGHENDTCRAFSPQVGPRGPHNVISDPFIGNISDLHLKLWDVSRDLYYAHFNVGDCTHYCRPGVQELSVYRLYQLLSHEFT